MTSIHQIEINERFGQALDVMENSGRSLFITGRAGTGKSTLLSFFRRMTAKKVVVLAPTGVAALNVKGQTIHSFFKFKPGITPEGVRRRRAVDDEESVYCKLDTIIIDEVSMVRADLMDCVDRFLRLNGPSRVKPFGGIQMVFIGDLYQLPPVVTGTEKEVFESLYRTPYFYGARVFEYFDMEIIELEKIYRQQDEQFIALLNGIRNNSVTSEGLALLNRRHLPEFEPGKDDFYVYLTTTNKLADEINNKQLSLLKGKSYHFSGTIEGEFGREYLPTAVDLQLKKGAQIMMLNNDAEGRWVNGSIGKVMDFDRDDKGESVIVAELDDGEEVDIMPFTWEIYRFYIEKGSMQSEVIGTFTQYPLMLAWAVTIHKSQGKTFDKVVIDIGRGTFAHGQMYVALSRCTSLEGIVLKKPALKSHIWTNYPVMGYLTGYQYRKAEDCFPAEDRAAFIRKAIENKKLLEIVYLKPNDEKTTRVVRPVEVGQMEYRGITYMGMRAFCLKRHGERTFRIDRILQVREVDEGRPEG